MSDRSSAIRDTVKEVNKATADSQDNLRDDLQSLKDDLAKLTEQVASVFAAKGSSAFQAARDGVEGYATEARDAVGEVTEGFTDAIDDALDRRPYTTLAMALGIGFVFGALWRR